tara:strand:- start:177 stop:860 length:684 start_codon:yes stop_codon:yes gene_type:complete
MVQRSLDQTLGNLNYHVFTDNCDLYVHTFDGTTAFANRDNGETKPTTVNMDSVYTLNAKKCIIDSEKEFNATFDFEQYEKYGDPFGNDFSSMRNLLRELYSVKKVYSLIDKSIDYDYVIMTRADLCFDRPLNTLKPNKYIDTVMTSQFNRAPFNHNDFFAVGSNTRALEVWANRLDYAHEFCLSPVLCHKGLHPESLITFCFEKFNVRHEFLDVKADRVRADGKIVR